MTAVENKIPGVSSLVKKPDLNAKITEIEGKIPGITGLAIYSALTAFEIEGKIPIITGLATNSALTAVEIEGKIPNITGLATNSALAAVENKIPGVSSLVKKTDYDAKILDIEKSH